MDDYVGRNDFCDAALDAIARGVGLFEAGGAWDTDCNVDEVALAGAAQTDAVDAEYAFDFFGGIGDFFLQAGGSDVEKRVESAPAETPSYRDHHSGDDERSERIGVAQPMN